MNYSRGANDTGLFSDLAICTAGSGINSNYVNISNMNHEFISNCLLFSLVCMAAKICLKKKMCCRVFWSVATGVF